MVGEGSYTLINLQPIEQSETTMTAKMSEVEVLLDSWELTILFPKFKNITTTTLRYLTEGDLQHLFQDIDDINHKCLFRAKLIEWRKQNVYNIIY